MKQEKQKINKLMRARAFGAGFLLLISVASAQQPLDFTDDTVGKETSVAVAANQTHQALRELRDRLFAAYEQRDMAALLNDVAPDVVITWQNAERNEGHAQLLEFYDKMMDGENRIVKDVSSELNVDGLSILYGDNVAVARGTLTDQFLLSDGSDFQLDSKWTATVVKIDNAWKVASFHVSSNMFDNPILSYAESWLIRVGFIGGAIGLVLGMVIGRSTRRSDKKLSANAVAALPD